MRVEVRGGVCYGVGMGADLDDILADVRRLVDAYRAQCLWFVRPGYYPKDAAEAVRTLQQIERNGDLEGFRKARELRACLSRISSAPSAA